MLHTARVRTECVGVALQESMGAAPLYKSVGAASLHKSMGAASLHKSMGAASLHKLMGAASLHKSMGAASLHKSMGAASLHKSVGGMSSLAHMLHAFCHRLRHGAKQTRAKRTLCEPGLRKQNSRQKRTGSRVRISKVSFLLRRHLQSYQTIVRNLTPHCVEKTCLKTAIFDVFSCHASLNCCCFGLVVVHIFHNVIFPT